jgi:4-amino-4-deoxy-L-arabinose transferase-like glycosyltransferase
MRPWLPESKSISPTANQESLRPSSFGGRIADLRNIALLVVGWTLLLILLPPAHDYPVIDDWIYSGSVQNQLATGVFTMPGQSQASLVGLTLWGTAWARLFGLSNTVLTYSTLTLAFAGLLAFYGLARSLKTPPSGALLGTALLSINPIFLHLSYSFMTDVPFLALVLISCYAYILGLQRRSFFWLLAGGLAAGWAFLIRQFGVLPPVGFLVYLGLDGLLGTKEGGRRWRWREILGVGVLPAAIVIGWWLWSRDMPPTDAMRAAEGWRDAFVLKEPWLRVFVLRTLYLLPVIAFTTWTAITINRRRWWLIPLGLFLIGLAAFWANTVSEHWIGQTEPAFTFQLGPLSFDLPREIYTFGGDGNIVRTDGIDFYGYHQEPIWSPEAWRTIYVCSLALGALLLAKIADSLLDWGRERLQRQPLTPLAGVYLTGLAIFTTTVALSGYVYDRYVLGFGAFLILFAARGSREWGRAAWGFALAAFVVLALFSVTLKAAAIDHTNARWQAGNWFVAHSVSPMVGLDWNQGFFDSNPPYQVTDVDLPGYRTEARFPYTSRLSGFATRYVLAQSRNDLPPLGQSSK